jgi:predicted O-methyltransferase YrrM
LQSIKMWFRNIVSGRPETIARSVRNIVSGRPEAIARSARNLDAIESLTLPENRKFLISAGAAQQIDGMFSDFSMSVIDCLLSRQNALGIKGNILELGTYKGRSAALMGHHLAEGERLVLVDLYDQLNRNAISPFEAAVDFLVVSTEELREKLPEYKQKRGTFRFIHIDASHAYRATFNELQIADELLAENGVIALDDFTNLDFSQNIAAIFKYLYTQKTDLSFFLVTNEKGYLCRKSQLQENSDFVLDRLIAEMKSRGVADAVLARTDNDPEYSAFYLRGREQNESGHFYGRNIYKNQILG